MTGTTGEVLERVAAAFAHREADRVPLWGIIQHRGLYEHVLGAGRVGTAAGTSLDDKIRLHAEVYAKLGIDVTRAQLWPPDPPRPDTPATQWVERHVDAAGIRAYQPKLPDDAARDEDVAVKCRQIAANAPHTVFAPTIRGIFCPVFEKMGLEQFSYAAADSPGEIDRLMQAHSDYARSLAERYAARPKVKYVAICDDMAFKSGLMFPPDWMRRNWRPKMAHILEPLRRAGIPVIFHSDGNIEAIIPDLIEMGFAAINPLEPLAGMDLARLKRTYGKYLTLIGGVDRAELLCFGTPRRIRDQVKRLLDIGAPDGGFIIGDSSQIMPDTPLANVLAFYETVHEYHG